jgi:hypothetical protein
MRRKLATAIVLGSWLAIASAGVASAGGVKTQFGTGAFGLPWNASKASIQAKYPGGQWSTDANGQDTYCVPSKQTLLKLPAPHQTRELCFAIGADGTLGSVTAHMNASLPSLLAVVNRSRTTFGDFDAVLRDDAAIQSKSTAMLWTKDTPLLVKVSSTNDADGSPVAVSFTISDEAALHSAGSSAVSNVPKAP